MGLPKRALSKSVGSLGIWTDEQVINKHFPMLCNHTHTDHHSKNVYSLRMQNFSLTQCQVEHLMHPFLNIFCITHLSDNIRKAANRMRDPSVNLETINNTVIGIWVNFSTLSATLSETALDRQREIRKQMFKECSSLSNIKHSVYF
jgi:hypothetical protein